MQKSKRMMKMTEEEETAKLAEAVRDELFPAVANCLSAIVATEKYASGQQIRAEFMLALLDQVKLLLGDNGE